MNPCERQSPQEQLLPKQESGSEYSPSDINLGTRAQEIGNLIGSLPLDVQPDLHQRLREGMSNHWKKILALSLTASTSLAQACDVPYFSPRESLLSESHIPEDVKKTLKNTPLPESIPPDNPPTPYIIEQKPGTEIHLEKSDIYHLLQSMVTAMQENLPTDSLPFQKQTIQLLFNFSMTQRSFP